jgi:hypothetical protein
VRFALVVFKLVVVAFVVRKSMKVEEVAAIESNIGFEVNK